MNRWIFWLRIVAYSCGFSGLALVLWGRQRPDEMRTWLISAGGVLMGVMFVLFLVTYVLFTLRTLRRRSTPSAGRIIPPREPPAA